jgi:hypothetical protein
METNPTETQKLFAALDAIDHRTSLLEAGHVELKEAIEFNNRATVQILNIVNTAKAFATVGHYVKMAAGWLAAVGGALAMLWEGAVWFVKHGG